MRTVECDRVEQMAAPALAAALSNPIATGGPVTPNRSTPYPLLLRIETASFAWPVCH